MTTIRSIRQPVATLSGGQRQSVAVARAVMWNSTLVILDEPTAALGVSQTEQVLALVKRLAEQGLAVVLISHNLHDIFEAANRITVLRLGRDIGVYDAGFDDAGGDRARDHRRSVRRRSPGSRAPGTERTRELCRAARRSLLDRGRGRELWASGSRRNIRGGNLGSAPVLGALLIVVIVFGFTAQNFFTPVNFTNLIGQMAGTCMLAYGVVFVLLIGEIDLSIGYVSGVAGMIAALLANPAPAGPGLPGWLCILIALACTTIIGAFQGSFVALIGVPSFVVTLAGLLIWQGVIQLELPGVIVIQDNTINNVYGYFFSDLGGWIIGIVVSVAYILGTVGSALCRPSPRHPDPGPADARLQGRGGAR